MGIFERADGEEVERKIAKQLNAQFHGNKSFEIGDIKKENGEVLEIKSSKDGTGLGTLANIGQNSITRYGLIENVPNWQEFREIDGFEFYRTELFKKRNKDPYFTMSDFLKKCREFLTEEDFKNIKNNSNENISRYIELLKTGNQNNDNIKIFTLNICSGKNKKNKYEKFLTDLDMNFSILCSDKEAIIKKQYRYDIDKEAVFKIKFLDKAKDIIIYAEKDNIKKDIMRIVFHWKNKGQGIQTPCLNVFYCGSIIEV